MKTKSQKRDPYKAVRTMAKHLSDKELALVLTAAIVGGGGQVEHEDLKKIIKEIDGYAFGRSLLTLVLHGYVLPTGTKGKDVVFRNATARERAALARVIRTMPKGT